MKITCYTSSSIGYCPTLCDNFDEHEESVSISWDDAFRFDDTSWLKVYHQVEPPSVMSGVVEKLIVNREFYDVILAWDERILNACPQAVFCTESCCSWLPRKADKLQDTYGTMNYGNGILHKNPVESAYQGCDVQAKRFESSFLTSSKNVFTGHVLRQEIYNRIPEIVGNIRVWKHRSPPVVNDKRTMLEPVQFSIVPENSRYSGYYSEKIVDCFVAKVVPLYWGCTDIGKHFNPKGIITFENYEDLLSKLSVITPDTYPSLLPAVEENFHKALQGVAQWSQIEAAISEGIARKHANLSVQPSVAPISATPRFSRQLRRP